MKTIVWIDDERNPFTGDWIKSNYSEYDSIDCVVWIKTFEQWKHYLEEFGLPYFVSFDHDLANFTCDGKEYTGLDYAKYMINEYCMLLDIPAPEFNVHSSNPCGAENIKSYINSYNKSIRKEKNNEDF